jgi:hypothetical protein
MLLALTLFSGNAKASDDKLLVVGGVDIAFKNTTVSADSTFDVPLTTVKPGVTLAKGRFYGSLAYERSVAAGVSTGIDTIHDPTAGPAPPPTLVPYTVFINREDLLFTAGYRATRSLNFFAGYIDGKIHVIKDTEEYDSGGTIVNGTRRIEYDRAGPFVGAAYSLPVGKAGAFNFSIAYAGLNGSIVQSKVIADGSGTGPVFDPRATFQLSGFSYGVNWSGELNGSISYKIGLNQTEYSSQSSGSLPSGITEKYNSLFFGVTNYF